jgi:hypothetical protein
MFCEAVEFVLVSLPCLYSGDLSLPFSSNKQGCSYRDWRLCVGFDHSIDSLYLDDLVLLLVQSLLQTMLLNSLAC